MDGYDKATYGERIVDAYDALSPAVTPGQIELLSELAGGGPVLELGIGTGRLALPLAEQGTEVHGIDASAAMVAKLRNKPGGSAVPVTVGDFSRFKLARQFSLVFVAFNTLFALVDQAAQVECFQSVARHLQPGGRFLVEAFIPDLGRYQQGRQTSAVRLTLDEVHLNCALHDAPSQRVTTQHVIITEGNCRLYPVEIRYAWPSEMDLMARLAGLELEERWDNWDRRPYTATSFTTVSVWRAPGS